MSNYQLHFTIPQQRQGERAHYQAFSKTLRELSKLKQKNNNPKGARIQEIEVTGGSIRGFATIEAESYQDALDLVCSNTPVIDLEWHLEERVEPDQVERILAEAMRR